MTTNRRPSHINTLPADGLLFNNMRTTALCSPSSSFMLTGRNHHANGMACITEASTGFPGANGNIPFENGYLSEILLRHVYITYAIAKWHLTPAEQTSATGPYDRPLALGARLRAYGWFSRRRHPSVLPRTGAGQQPGSPPLPLKRLTTLRRIWWPMLWR